MKNIKNILKNLLIYITVYFGLLLINNIRNIANILINNSGKIVYTSLPLIISLIIFLFYIYKVRKKNKYFNISFIMIFLFYNFCNGLLYSSNLHTFFLLYIILIIFSFYIYTKINNYSYSLITGFSLMILSTFVLGMFGLLKLVKYLLPIVALLILILLLKDKDKTKSKLNDFFNKEHLIFTILFIIAIIGGIGRFVHIYDEYSHWAYDAKAVIHYNEISTSQEIMSKTRQYAPLITSWHYIVAQFSEYQESNLYIGLSIFCMVYIMSIFHNVYKKNNLFIMFSILVSYTCAFYLGGVYNFNSLYADFAMGCVFGATLLNYYSTKKELKNKKFPFYTLLIMLTLIKPSGCVSSFTVLFIMFMDYILKEKISFKNILKKCISFFKDKWKYILVVLMAFLIWNIYVKTNDVFNVEFYDYDVRPLGLYADLKYKLNIEFILNFVKNVIFSLDQTLIYAPVNLSFYQYILITFLIIFILRKFNLKNNEEKNKKFISLVAGYFVFFILTILSVFVMLCSYEASILASVGRYLGCIHVAFIFLVINYIINENFVISKLRLYISVCIIIILLFGLSVGQVFYFITDFNEREITLNIKDQLTDKFKPIVESTEEKSNVYIIDQKDKDGIMAMWYARYYLFPRKVNASSNAISWKILTTKNTNDLQDWGMNSKDLEESLIKYKFNYLYLYTADDEFYEVTKDMYLDYKNAKKYDLFEVVVKNNKVTLVPVK